QGTRRTTSRCLAGAVSEQRLAAARTLLVSALICVNGPHRPQHTQSDTHFVVRERLRRSQRTYMASNMAAMPCPPPMHSVTSAYLPPIRRSSYSAFTTRMQPVAPTG